MASRKERKEQLRAERMAAEQTEAAAERRKRTIGIGIAGVLAAALVAVIVLVVASGGGGAGSGAAHIANVGGITTTSRATPDDRTGTKTTPGPLATNLQAAAKAAKCKVVNPPDEGNTHLAADQPTPKYKTDPPTSGNHDPVPQADGAYMTDPPSRHFVHSLEHGRIEIQYAPGLSAVDQLALKGVFDEAFEFMLMFPNRTMKWQVAASAWDHYIGCPNYNDRVPDAIRAFRDTYRGNGPEPTSSQPNAS
jgi:hypothetical protein